MGKFKMGKFKFVILGALFSCALSAQNARAQKIITDFAAKESEPARILSGNGPLSFEKISDGVKITVQPDQWWPGYSISFPHDMRDLSDFGGVELDIENPENFAQNLGFRADNEGADGQKHCNVEGYTLAPGERKTIQVWFGISNGKPGFPLNTKAVIGICLFWNQPKQTGSFVLRSIKTLPPHPAYTMLKPREYVSFKFSADESVSLSNLRGGAWAEGAKALGGGGRSLSGDTFPDGKAWFEFWESRAGLLAGSFTYEVKFDYKVVDADENATLYSLFRSQGKGWGAWDRGWSNIEELPAKKGQILTQKYNVDLPRFKDYFMMLGINGRAHVVVDNIEITRMAPFDDGDLRRRADAKRNANAEQRIMVDFEADALPATARIAAGKISAAPADVLLGKRSFVADTIGGGREWNEVFTVGRGKLDAGYEYHVTMPVRMDKKGPKGGSVYVAAQASDGQKIGWRSWNSGEGEDDVITTVFSFREGDGYELLVGIQNEARVVFDEIEIRREPLPPDRVPLMKVRDKAKSKLIFEDNFDGDKLDETKWTVTQDRPHRGAMYRKANATLDGKGNLVMEFKPDGDTFSSTELNTNGKFGFTYGYAECRMMLPKFEGHWPGFWLFNGNVTRVGNAGRDGTEVDIVEAPWRHEDKVTHNLHWDGYGDDHASAGSTPAIPGINEGWHTFAVDWQPDGYIFLVDGTETWRSDAGGVCENPLFIILSDEMGGWSGNPWNVDKKNFPDKILVDYVRVWQ